MNPNINVIKSTIFKRRSKRKVEFNSIDFSIPWTDDYGHSQI